MATKKTTKKTDKPVHYNPLLSVRTTEDVEARLKAAAVAISGQAPPGSPAVNHVDVVRMCIMGYLPTLEQRAGIGAAPAADAAPRSPAKKKTPKATEPEK